MKPKTDRKQPAAASSAPRRFRLEKLEDRIAPKKGGKGTVKCYGFTESCRC